tara:strand:+ start:539 stop:1153 length:615 start_codon:yes stop_codon:yes gene_type:complete
MDIIIVFVFSYLCGSIPFGFILTKLFSKQDIRSIGSGNIGATNVLRTGNKILAAITLLFDALKGYIPVIISLKYFPELTQLSCVITFLGHVFPLWLKFKGGKGVATYLGILFALDYGLSFLFIFTWTVVFLIFKYSSVASIFSSLTVFVVNSLLYTVLKSLGVNIIILGNNINILLFILFILIVFTHQKNISNLKNKTEPKIKI